MKKILRYLDEKKVSYECVRSYKAESIDHLVKKLCEENYKTVVIIGGDASINDAINGIMTAQALNKDFAFGIIPSGSANDFVKFWNIKPNEYKKAVDAILKRNIRNIDVGVCKYTVNDEKTIRYFLNCVNIGLGAKLIGLSKNTKILTGSQVVSNISTMVGQVFERKSFNLEFKTDTEQLCENVMSVCIGNTLGYGQTPNAVPYNGMLDMSVITRPKWWQLFEGFWLLGKGKFLNYKNVSPYRIVNVRFTDIGKARISLDGRIIPQKNIVPLTISVNQEKIPLIIPPL